MWSKLGKNCIIKGPLDSYCLVCECLVGNVDKIDKHIKDPYHEKRLEMYPHLEKYTKDCIRKIEGVYFCEFCGITLGGATKVNIHISSRKHLNNRGLQQLTAGPDSGVVALNEALISEDAWHVIGDNCCLLCDEVNVDPKHIHSRNHLLKLLQSKIEFLENGLYRKIDEHTVQCLSCNILFEMNLINNHFDSRDHKVAYTKCKVGDDNLNNEVRIENINEHRKANDEPINVLSEVRSKDSKANNEPENVLSEVKSRDSKANDESENILYEVKSKDSKANDEPENVLSEVKLKDGKANDEPENVLSEVKAKDSKANDEPENVLSEVKAKDSKANDEPENVVSEVKAEGSKANDKPENVLSVVKAKYSKANDDSENTVSVGNSKESTVNNDQENVLSQVKVEDIKGKVINIMSEAVVKEIKEFSNNNEITYNLGEDTAYCRVCEISMAPSLRFMKEHVTENKHVEKLKFYKPILKRECLKAFAEQLNLVETGWSYDIVINNKICIDFKSFFLIHYKSNNFVFVYCHCCTETYGFKTFGNSFVNHLGTLRHIKVINDTPVVTTFADEFLREIRPNVFHCGFCNICYTWQNILKHLQSEAHKSEKKNSEYRLSLITHVLQEENSCLQSKRIEEIIKISLETVDDTKIKY